MFAIGLKEYGEYSTLNTRLFNGSCRSALGFSIGTTRKLRPGWFAETALTVLSALESCEIRITIAAKFLLEDVAKAHASL